MYGQRAPCERKSLRGVGRVMDPCLCNPSVCGVMDEVSWKDSPPPITSVLSPKGLLVTVIYDGRHILAG